MIWFSIIIPVYNVDKYLKECIDSVISQTYRNLTIILIDDGSNDESSALCDEYQLLDERIVTLHKINGGLSDARNYGIAYIQNYLDAKCDYICFVDSDDYVVPYMLERLKQEVDNNYDIVGFNSYEVNDNGKEVSKPYTKLQFTPKTGYNTEERLSFLISANSLGDFAWNKAYKKYVFEQIRYPYGKYFEDVFTTYKAFDRAKSIRSITDCLYVYRRRAGSITKEEFSQRKMDDFLDAVLQKSEYIEKRLNKKTECDHQVLGVVLIIINNSAKAGVRLNNKKINELRRVVVERKEILKNKQYFATHKNDVIFLRLFIFSYNLFYYYIRSNMRIQLFKQKLRHLKKHFHIVKK